MYFETGMIESFDYKLSQIADMRYNTRIELIAALRDFSISKFDGSRKSGRIVSLLRFIDFFTRMPKKFNAEDILNILSQSAINIVNIEDIVELNTPDVWESVFCKTVSDKAQKTFYIINIVDDSKTYLFENPSQILFSQTKGATILVANTEIENYEAPQPNKIYNATVMLSKLDNYLQKKRLLSVNAKYTTDNLGSYSAYDEKQNKIKMVAHLREEEKRDVNFVYYLLLCVIRDYAKLLILDKIEQAKEEQIDGVLSEFEGAEAPQEYSFLASISALFVGKHFSFDTLGYPIITDNGNSIKTNDYFKYIYDFAIPDYFAKKLRKNVDKVGRNNDEYCIFDSSLELARDVSEQIIELIEELLDG